ncbi:hypothetical protein QWE_00460 [Agrobacterium albertimagni AOL15]|uniref:DUF2934 domain-containing protein n=1 Tax=Agrobacterium albertimagni AOL15 TaxID=1156935 RepID=K2PL01_9HYPH|nr:DUF2934 domain-containing protein [Agrobacterium albertimagni]EKF61628.1 hypothetical protein QWE_00460 [Agrobacterium albertimagni AOL15]
MDREQQQRERAYQIWEEEGRPSDKHEDHWERAGRATPSSPDEADAITEANEAASAQFAGDDGKGKAASSAALLKMNPD